MGWLQVSADFFLFLLQQASFKLTSSISAMTAQFSDISTSPRKMNTWNETFEKLISQEINSLFVCFFFYKSLDEVSASILIFPRKSLILFDVMATFDDLFQHLGAVMPLQSAVKSTFTFTCKGCTWVKISCYRVNSHFLKSKVFIDQKSKSTILPRFVCMYILYTTG